MDDEHRQVFDVEALACHVHKVLLSARRYLRKVWRAKRTCSCKVRNILLVLSGGTVPSNDVAGRSVRTTCADRSTC